MARPFHNSDLIVTLKPIFYEGGKSIPVGTRGRVFFASPHGDWLEVTLEGHLGLFSPVLKKNCRHVTPQERMEMETAQMERWKLRVSLASLKELEETFAREPDALDGLVKQEIERRNQTASEQPKHSMFDPNNPSKDI